MGLTQIRCVNVTGIECYIPITDVYGEGSEYLCYLMVRNYFSTKQLLKSNKESRVSQFL